jgi:hypothetical protein
VLTNLPAKQQPTRTCTGCDKHKNTRPAGWSCASQPASKPNRRGARQPASPPATAMRLRQIAGEKLGAALSRVLLGGDVGFLSYEVDSRCRAQSKIVPQCSQGAGAGYSRCVLSANCLRAFADRRFYFTGYKIPTIENLGTTKVRNIVRCGAAAFLTNVSRGVGPIRYSGPFRQRS